MTLDEMILDWELNGEATESNELVRMEKLIRALIAERKERAGQLAGGDARTMIAVMAMRGQIEHEGMEGCDKELIAGMSVELADALLAALERGRK